MKGDAIAHMNSDVIWKIITILVTIIVAILPLIFKRTRKGLVYSTTTTRLIWKDMTTHKYAILVDGKSIETLILTKVRFYKSPSIF